MKYPFALKVELDLAAPIDRVFAAMTNPETVQQLFWGSELLTTWVPGTPIVFRGTYDGVSYEDHGTVLAFDPPHLVKFDYWSSWSKAELDDLPENYQHITYVFSPSEVGTLVSIEQDNIRSEEIKEHSTQNWQHMLHSLREMVEG